MKGHVTNRKINQIKKREKERKEERKWKKERNIWVDIKRKYNREKESIKWN